MTECDDNYKIAVFKGPCHPFCMFEPNIFNFHIHNVTDNHFPKHTIGMMNLKMIFLLSRPPLVSVHSGIKINLLILEMILG
ncbi:hypothetical protein LDENG_00102030 [Lucifuga dentata]|nr:hypothetical protein LDENG_00102030 [Lucifuga dentata]